MIKGVNADKWEVNKGWYSIIPEAVDQAQVETIHELNKQEAAETGGWNKTKTMKKIGTIPYSVMYNYAIANGVPSEQHHEWYSIEKSKNLLGLLNEFPHFKVGQDIT